MTCRRVTLFRPLVRPFVLYLAGWMGAAVVPARAWAQAEAALGGSMPLPLAVDLKKVPTGSWSEYRVDNGQNTMTIHMALVARSAGAVEVETQIKGGPVAALGRTTIRMSLPSKGTGEIKPREQVMQIGDNPPMSLPTEVAGPRAQSFRRLDPKERIGVESVTVPGGTFPRADHYRQKGTRDEVVDFWISTKVLPFGLVKVTSTALGGGATPVLMELTGNGGGAKPAITKRPQAFDPAVIMKQAQPALGADAGTSGAGGPPLRPIPSPHPGMAPVTPGSAAARPSPKPAPLLPPPAGGAAKAK
ncbi:MAG: hypothetical protein ABUS79_09195 [Pseudomonadota bacterium]